MLTESHTELVLLLPGVLPSVLGGSYACVAGKSVSHGGPFLHITDM